MSEPTWILFDIGGVLEVVDDHTWQDAWWRRWRERAGAPDADIDELVVSGRLPSIDVVSGRADEFWQVLGDRLALAHADREAMRMDFWDAYCGAGNTELIEYARSLRGRASLAILSNSADGAREQEERRYGFSEIFDPICYSHEQGVNKPEERAYTLALARMNAEPAQVFFVDDHQHAVDGAAAAGIRGVVHVDNATTMAAIEGFLAGS
ncbi:MAG: HAD family hydrolase [Microbacterium sp.]